MRILGIDFETAGTKKEGVFRAVEVGFAVFNAETLRIESSHGYLLNDLKISLGPDTSDLENYYQIPEKITEIHGLTTDVVLARGKDPLYFLADLVQEDLYQIDAIMVWNGYFFDRPLLFDMVTRFFAAEYQTLSEQLTLVPWLDLKLDGGYKYRLDHEAADRGILSAYPHMGLADVITMFRVLKHDMETKKQDIYALFSRAESPFVIVKANTTYHEKDLAKAQGFRWNSELRVWWKLLREKDLIGLELPFTIETQIATSDIYEKYFSY